MIMYFWIKNTTAILIFLCYYIKLILSLFKLTFSLQRKISCEAVFIGLKEANDFIK